MTATADLYELLPAIYRIRDAEEGGTLEAQEDAAGRATLTESAVLELAGLGRRVAALFDAPQDVEWAQVAGRFHLLQARPITTLFPIPAFGIRLLFGEMGDALLLSSSRVEPASLTKAGYQFQYQRLGEALRHSLTVGG